MSPHGYIDDDGRPRLVVTIPAHDGECAQTIIRAGWLGWAATCDDLAQLPMIVGAALTEGVDLAEIAAAMGMPVATVEAMIRP